MGEINITEHLIDILSEEFEVPREKFTPNALLKDDLGFDSLDMVDVVVLINDEFNIKLVSQDFIGRDTFGKLVDLLNEKIK